MAEATIDQQFIEYIVKTLVGNPDNVRIERKIDERGVLLELYVDAEDLGRVIGRNGATAKSIRTLLRALGVKNDARYNLKIVDTNDGGRREDEQSSTSASDQPSATGAAQSASPTEDAKTASDQPATSSDATTEPSDLVSTTDQPTEPSHPADEPTPAEKAESDVARHRREIDDLTSGLDL